MVLVLLVRSRLRNARASLWLDGLIGAVATTAPSPPPSPTARSSTRAAPGDLSPAVLTGLAYPVGDLLLLGVVVAIFGLTGWRPGRAWIVLGIGLALNAAGDGIYLVQTADGTWPEGSLVNALWPASVAARRAGRLAAGRSCASAPKDQSLRVVIVPVVCGLIARRRCWPTTTSRASTG